jgi:hypothetical protein
MVAAREDAVLWSTDFHYEKGIDRLSNHSVGRGCAAPQSDTALMIGIESTMVNQVLLHLGAALTAFWGIAHLFPTRSVVKGFGDISLDNKRVITMEWIIEGVSLIFIGVVVSGVTCMDHTSEVSKAVYLISFAMLNTLSVISLFTGFKVSFLPYKLCPVIFTTSSVVILLGSYL